MTLERIKRIKGIFLMKQFQLKPARSSTTAPVVVNLHFYTEHKASQSPRVGYPASWASSRWFVTGYKNGSSNPLRHLISEHLRESLSTTKNNPLIRKHSLHLLHSISPPTGLTRVLFFLYISSINEAASAPFLAIWIRKQET